MAPQRLIHVTNDLFDIADRLKSINDGYRVFYNADSGKYEVHHFGQGGSSLAFVCPYDQLDCRTVEYARQTAIGRIDKLVKELDDHNAKLEASRQTKVVDKALSTAQI